MSEIRFNRWSHQSGTGGIYQDSSGNIGIGTSVPTSVLDIQGGSIKIGNDLLTSSGVSTFTSGLNVTGGSVGIGTDNPGLPLDIVSNASSETVRFRGGSTGTGTLRFTSNDGATNYNYIQSRSTFFKLGSDIDIPVIIEANSEEIVRVEDNTVHIGDRSGNNNSTHFGTSRVSICGPDPIGTTVTKANSYLAIGNNESELDGVYPITFGYTTNTNDYQPAYIAYKTTNSGSAEYGDIIFGTRNVTTDTEPSERLRITSDGQVNISAIDGTFRNPSITNIQRNGLIIFPSSSNGSYDYADNHMLSIAQGQGNWLDSETSTNHTSWGPLWAFNNGSTFQKRAGIHYDSRSTEQFKFWSSYGDFVFKTDTGRSGDETAETCDREGLRITYQGYVTKSGMPSFAAGWSGTDVSWNVSSNGWTKITMDSERWDNRGNYDTSTSRFTAPVAGYYLFGCVLQLENPSYSGNPWMYINPLVNGSTSSVGQGGSRTDAALIDYYNHYQRTDLLELAAGDYVEYWRTGNLTSITFKGGSESYWWGYLVG